VEELQEKYPEQKIYLVDSLAASSGFGLIMETLADMRDSGMEIGELYAWIEETKLRMQHWFFSTDLTFYIKGGRVSKTAGMVGNVLNICPLLNVDNLGRLQPREKIRGKKKVINRIVEKMEEHAKDGHDYSGKCYISYSACLDDALKVASIIEQKFPKLQEQVQLYPIGATIGSHTGPGTVALFFWGDERVD
jgi:DegV family protein with EDD domain